MRNTSILLSLGLSLACSAGGAAAPPNGGGGGGAPVTFGTGGSPGVPPPTGAGGSDLLVLVDASKPHRPSGDASVMRRDDCGKITAIVRDFSAAHPDFEMNIPIDIFNPASWLTPGQKGIVQPTLVNGYPAYAPPGPTPQTTGPQEFYEWYVDIPAVNIPIKVILNLVETTPGTFVYDNSAFFPIDNQGFGNEGNPHNFHFTTEVRTEFTYRGGESFLFRGDDDLWVFVNGALVMDLGGMHAAQEATVVMDAVAPKLGLVPGNTYPMDLFQAERHTTESNFHLETSIDCFVTVEPPPPPPRPPR